MDNPNRSSSEIYLNDIRSFLAEGGDKHHCDEFGDYLLHVAAKSSGAEVVEVLREAGANVNLLNAAERTPLHIAVIYRNRNVVDALFNFRIVVDYQDCYGNAPLHYAINICASMAEDWKCIDPNCAHPPPDIYMIQRLLGHEVTDVNARNFQGFTPLLWAFKDKNPDVIQLLLRHSALVNIGNYRHETPLHAALTPPSLNLEIVKELLRLGANFTCKNHNHLSPLDLVFNRRDDENSEVLKEKLLKLVALYDRNNEFDILEVNMTGNLLGIYAQCREEIYRMRRERIFGNSLYDVVLQYLKDRAVIHPELVKVAFEVLWTRGYNVYYAFILSFSNPNGDGF